MYVCVLIALPLRVTYKLLKFSLFEQATAVEFTKICRQFLAYIFIYLICSRFYDAFDQKAINIRSVFHVIMFIIL